MPVNSGERQRKLTQIMKQATRKPAQRPAAASRPAKPQNPQINVQTRKVLKQHYRAKYGVK
ncbi:MAG: hypothetical protein ACREVZ_12745 [Burkholderiales bacterium]